MLMLETQVCVCDGMTVFKEFLVINVMKLLNNCSFFCGELSFDMLCNFHISKFLNGAKLLFDAVSVLF